jgi:hypothetical protein
MLARGRVLLNKFVIESGVHYVKFSFLKKYVNHAVNKEADVVLNTTCLPQFLNIVNVNESDKIPVYYPLRHLCFCYGYDIITASDRSHTLCTCSSIQNSSKRNGQTRTPGYSTMLGVIKCQGVITPCRPVTSAVSKILMT